MSLQIGRKNVKEKLDNILIPFTVLGAILFLLTSATTARSAASESAPGARQSASSQAPGGQALAGTWKLNRAQSDDPAKRLVSDDNISTGDTGTNAPIAGQTGGLPNSSQNGTSLGGPPTGGLGAPGGMSGGGGQMPMPLTPPSHRWETDKDRQKTRRSTARELAHRRAERQ